MYKLKSKVTFAKEVNINSYLICKDDVKDIQTKANGLDIKIFNDPATAEAMSEDKITGGVEMFILDETFQL